MKSVSVFFLVVMFVMFLGWYGGLDLTDRTSNNGFLLFAAVFMGLVVACICKNNKSP